MTMTMNSISKLALLLFVSIAISACGGNKKTTSKASGANKASVANTGDITRPPVVEKDVARAETAAADGETISFDEWRKRREAEKKKQDQ